MRGYASCLCALVVAAPLVAAAGDTATCDGKRSWQREIVRRSVHHWVAGDPRSEDLLELIQAEQGIVACRSGKTPPVRLHTTTLPRSLQPDQLGPILLSNELEWNGAIPRPEDGLVGQWFEVRLDSAPVGDALGDAE